MPIKSKNWTPEEDKLLADCVEQKMSDPEIHLLMPNRTVSAITARRQGLKLMHYSAKRFTSDDDTYIRQTWADHVPTEEIAEKLNRSIGTIQQRVHYLGLKRDSRKTILAKRYGPGVLQISDDPVVIRAVMNDNERKQKAAIAAENKDTVKQALDAMEVSIGAGIDRRLAMQAARLAGASLEQISQRFGITRERVRQITERIKTGHRAANPRKIEPRTITCIRCQKPFTVETFGRFKYCTTCAPIVQVKSYERNKQRSKAAYRANPEKYKAYNRKYYQKRAKVLREQRLMEALAEMTPTDGEMFMAKFEEKTSGTGSNGDNNS
jgi:transposase